jgi:DNA primase
MIPAAIIDEVRSKADIVRIISDYLPLKKRGKNYLGSCPFHAEKDPSFTVSPDKQFFHCFGCQEGGNVFAFIMKIENISFVEAVAELGAKVGVAVPQVKSGDGAKTDREQYYQVTQMAAKYFQGQLSQAAKDYLSQRGISDETIHFFGLGFAPAAWDELFKHLVSRGVNPKVIEKTGLALPREGKNSYYDRFRNRLIFPVTDQRGRVVAFGGRALGNEEPKYLNSPDTVIYQKGETLFGLGLTKDEVKKTGSAVMVEGNFDLLTPFQSGIKNIVATMGTALTTSQCKLLARYCDTVVLAFDADAAGGNAAERSIELLKNQGLKVKVAKLTGGKDPDEIIKKSGAAAFKQCLATALPHLEFKLQRILARHNLAEIESRSKALTAAAKILSQEPDDFVRKEYAKQLAATLRTDLETILAEINREQNQQIGIVNQRRVIEKPNSKLETAEKCLIALAVQDPAALTFIREQLDLNDLTLPAAKAAAELLLSTDLAKLANPAHFLLENLPDEAAKKFLTAALVSEPLPPTDKQTELLNDCLKTIKQERVKKRIADIKLEMKEAEETGQTTRVAELLSTLNSEILRDSSR